MSDDEKKKLKVEFAPGVFDNVPEEDREELLKEILSTFEGKDAEEIAELGQPVRPIEPGTTVCPNCGSDLEEPYPMELPDGKALFYDCDHCDHVFGHSTQ